MALENALANVPGLAGALGMQQYRQQQQSEQLGQATNVARLEDMFRQQEETQKVRAILGSGKSPEEIIPALAAIGPTGGQYAQHYIQALQGAENLKLTKELGGKNVDQMAPADLDRLGQRFTLSGHPGGAGLIGLADKKRKLQSDADTYNTFKSTDEPNSGLFGSLTTSEIPAIANQAKMMQARLEASDPRSIPPQHWLDIQKQLAGQEQGGLQAKSMAQMHADLQKGTPESIESTAKLIAEYRMPPLSGNAARSPGAREVMARVQAINPNYNGQRYAAAQQTLNAFTKGKQGDTVRSFNVGISHLDTLAEAGKALQNSDTPAFNRLANEISKQSGAAAPGNFEAVRDIVSNEITKAIIGAGGGVSDREEAHRKISAANSPAQLSGVIEEYKKLMGGQLAGLRRQYEAGTDFKDFDDKFLSPEARKVAKQYNPDEPGKPQIAPPVKAPKDMTNAELAARKRELTRARNGS